MKKVNLKWTVHTWNNTYNSYRKFACKSFVDEYGIYHFVPYEKCEWVNVVSPFISPIHVTSYPISNVYILLKSDDQTNTAEFDVPATCEIQPGDIISIRCNDEVVHGYKTGIVREIQEKNDKTKRVITVDPSILLKRIYCRHEQVGFFNNKIVIRNPDVTGHYLTLGEFATIKLTQKYLGDWASSLPYIPPELHDNTSVYVDGVCEFEGYSKLSIHPLRNNEYLPSLTISELSLYESYNKLFRDICGFNIWYNAVEEGSLRCHVDYGFIRTKYHTDDFPSVRIDEYQYSEDYGMNYLTNGILIDVNKEFIVDTKRIDNNLVREPVDEVIVYGNTGLKGKYSNPDISFPSTSVIYKVHGNFGNDELNWLAERIYTDRRINDSTYKISFMPGCIRFKDGEFFGGESSSGVIQYGIGDETIQPLMPFRHGMDYDPRNDPSDSVWQINEVIMTDTKTEITVGSSYITVFEMFKDKLTEVKKGIDLETETRTYTTGQITLNEGFHPNILYENLILPGNATGDITIRTSITNPVKESARTIPHEKETTQFYFQVPSVTLPALSDPFIIESGKSFATEAANKEIKERQLQFKHLYEVPFIEYVPAKYDLGEITIQYQIGCGEEDNNYRWCAAYATSLMLPLWLLHRDLVESKNKVSAIECGNASVRCSQATQAVAYYFAGVHNIIGDIQDKINAGRIQYLNLYNDLYDINDLILNLQSDYLNFFGDTFFASTYFDGCTDDIDVTIQNCRDLYNNVFVPMEEDVRDIVQDMDTVITSFCDSTCEDLKILEVNEINPTYIPDDVSYDFIEDDDERNACDICIKLNNIYDKFNDFYESHILSLKDNLYNYIEQIMFIKIDCDKCRNDDKALLISTCNSKVTQCDADYAQTLSELNELEDSPEKSKLLRQAKRDHYTCINTVTHHYMDCNKLGDRNEELDCELRCREGICFNNIVPEFRNFVNTAQRLKNDIFTEFPTFIYDIYIRYKRYNESYIFLDEFASNVTYPLDTYLSNYFYGQLSALCSDKCSGSKNEILNRFTIKINEYEDWFNEQMKLLQLKCMDESTTFDVKFDVDFELDPSEYPTFSTFDAEALEIVESDNSKVHILNAEPYTTLNQYFKIKAWPGVIPINQFGNLPKSIIRIYIQNQSMKYPVYLENIHIKVVFYHYSDTPFTVHDRSYSEMMVHAMPTTTFDNLYKYPFFVYLSDYTEPVQRVVANIMRYDVNTSQYYQDPVFMYPTSLLGDIQIYAASDYDWFSSSDKLYYDQNGSDGKYFVQVVTPTTISRENSFKSLWVESLHDPNDPDCVFRIHIIPKYLSRNGTEFATDISVIPQYEEINTHMISIDQLWESLNLVQFYNVITGDFSSTLVDIYADIPRYAIDPVYYEALPNTYKNNAFFIPKYHGTSNFISEMPTITINLFTPERFPTTSNRTFTIFDGGELKFSDNLMNAPEDGVRSRDVFLFGSSNINTISVNSSKRYTYEFNIDYSVYKDVHCDLEYESAR